MKDVSMVEVGDGSREGRCRKSTGDRARDILMMASSIQQYKKTPLQGNSTKHILDSILGISNSIVLMFAYI